MTDQCEKNISEVKKASLSPDPCLVDSDTERIINKRICDEGTEGLSFTIFLFKGDDLSTVWTHWPVVQPV